MYLFCVWVLSACMPVCCMCIVPIEARRGLWSLWITGGCEPVTPLLAVPPGAGRSGGAGGRWYHNGVLVGEGAAAWPLGVLQVGEGLGLGPRQQGSPAGISDIHLSLLVQVGWWVQWSLLRRAMVLSFSRSFPKRWNVSTSGWNCYEIPILGTEGIIWPFGGMLLECTISGFDS